MSKASLELQTRKIDEYRTLAAPFRKVLAGLTIEVQPNVYPGGTDSELLAESIMIEPGAVALDICTGNGVVALSMSKNGAAKVIGTDLNPAAINNALRNKELQNLVDVDFIETDMFPNDAQQYDVISINPPYTDSQAPDKTAICFWDKDNRVVRTFFEKLHNFLKPTGRAYITWSSFADQELIPKLAKNNGFNLELISSKGGKSGFIYYVFLITRQ